MLCMQLSIIFMSSITFNNQKSPFFRALKTKVDSYFSTNELQPTGNFNLYFKGILQILSAATLYTILVFFTPHIFLSVILCALFGINLALLGFNIMHEGGHQSFSKYSWLNKASAYFLNILGGSAYFWKIKHNINHHTYTNIEGMDDDLEIEPFMRLHADQKRRWFHRFQFLYWVFLYGFSYFTWIFYNDFSKYFSGKVTSESQRQKLSKKEHFIFWLTKAAYIAGYILVPIFMVGLLKALIGFAIVTFVCGFFISSVFQLAHVVEKTQFPNADPESNKINNEWAVHQMQTTSDFGTNNKLLTWLLGGLNFQVEHHLFPKISHIHYPKISQFVKETAMEFDIQYNVYSSAFTALKSHVIHLKRMGKATV